MENIISNGGTYPSTILWEYKADTQNLIITTDGEIYEGDLPVLKGKLELAPNLKNVVAILIMNAPKPMDLNLSVFYGFYRHTTRMGGSFYLFALKEYKFQDCGGDNNDKEKKNYFHLLMKRIPENMKKIDKPPEPVEEYTEETKWEDIPKIDINE